MKIFLYSFFKAAACSRSSSVKDAFENHAIFL